MQKMLIKGASAGLTALMLLASAGTVSAQTVPDATTCTGEETVSEARFDAERLAADKMLANGEATYAQRLKQAQDKIIRAEQQVLKKRNIRIKRLQTLTNKVVNGTEEQKQAQQAFKDTLTLPTEAFETSVAGIVNDYKTQSTEALNTLFVTPHTANKEAWTNGVNAALDAFQDTCNANFGKERSALALTLKALQRTYETAERNALKAYQDRDKVLTNVRTFKYDNALRKVNYAYEDADRIRVRALDEIKARARAAVLEIEYTGL